MGNYWKTLERNVAKYFNTTRRKRGDDFSQSDCEIVADVGVWLGTKKDLGTKIIAECKYRSAGLGVIDTFKKLKDSSKISLGLIGNEYIILDLENFEKVFFLFTTKRGIPVDLLFDFIVFKVKSECPEYVNEFIDQARKYIPENAEPSKGVTPTLPILCCAKRGTKGIYAIFSVMDVKSFCETKNSN